PRYPGTGRAVSGRSTAHRQVGHLSDQPGRDQRRNGPTGRRRRHPPGHRLHRRSRRVITLDLGSGTQLHAVLDGWARMEVREAFGDQAESIIAAHPQYFDDGWFEFPIGAFLLHGKGRVTLIDAGAGPRDSWVRSGALLDNLALLGVTPKDVDDVVYTHLHWDHIGWASQKGHIIFPSDRKS